MPFDGDYGYCSKRIDPKRRAAWKNHYIAKGCHPVKATRLADDKCRKKETWP